jgi:hypothetical protein
MQKVTRKKMETHNKKSTYGRIGKNGEGFVTIVVETSVDDNDCIFM